MHPQVLAAAHVQGGVFTARQAYLAGYSVSEVQTLVRARELHQLRRGVYATRHVVEAAGTPTARHALDAAAALVAVRGAAAASHTTAAALHGLASIAPPPSTVVLTHPTLGTTRNYPGLRVTPGPLPDAHVRTPCGLRATSAARTVVDNARKMPFREGVVLADSALRLRSASRAEMEDVLRYCHAWRGIRDAQRVVAFADQRTDAASESVARVVFAEHRLPPPEPQTTLADERGVIGVVDFYWRRFRTVAEIDGKIKYVSEEGGGRIKDDRLWREKLRQERLHDAGFEVVRITWRQLLDDPEGVSSRILRAFQRGLARAS